MGAIIDLVGALVLAGLLAYGMDHAIRWFSRANEALNKEDKQNNDQKSTVEKK